MILMMMMLECPSCREEGGKGWKGVLTDSSNIILMSIGTWSFCQKYWVKQNLILRVCTNDLKGVDSFFRILENFILETILPNSTTLTKRHVYIFLLRFQKYLDSSKPCDGKKTNVMSERDHLVRRVQFVKKKKKKERWVEKLQLRKMR